MGAFVERLNRFVSRVELDGEIHLVHVPNSGRMLELLTPGATVGVAHRGGEHRRTQWDLMIVKYGEIWVCVDSRQANEVVGCLLEPPTKATLESGPLKGAWQELRRDLTGIRREVRMGRHVLDFILEKGERRALVEVKSVNLVEDGCALFPDAPTIRGREHVELLASSCERGEEAHLLFVVLRADAKRCSPHADRDPEFALALRRAERAGVQMSAISCSVSPHAIELLGPLPVVLS